MSLLFIYGTLKQGFCRHAAMRSQTFLGEVVTQPRYQLIDLIDYPGLIEVAENSASIQGELWEVSAKCLHRLDQIEAVDEGLYERRAIQLVGNHSEIVESYFYLGDVAGLPTCGNSWLRKPLSD